MAAPCFRTRHTLWHRADGTTEIAVISLGGIVSNNSIKMAGDDFTSDIREYMSRQHNDANVLCLGERVTGPGLAEMMLDVWLDTEFAGGRHERRVHKIMAIEK